MNSVILIGRLTRDPELRYIPGSQNAVATFTLAIDRPVRADAEKKTDFIRITVFGRQAENCERFLKKGRKVAVQGSIQTGSYVDKDGKTVYTTDVVARNVEFLDWGDRSEGGGSGSYEPRYGQSDRGSRGASDRNDDIPDGFQELQDEDVPF